MCVVGDTPSSKGIHSKFESTALLQLDRREGLLLHIRSATVLQGYNPFCSVTVHRIVASTHPVCGQASKSRLESPTAAASLISSVTSSLDRYISHIRPTLEVSYLSHLSQACHLQHPQTGRTGLQYRAALQRGRVQNQVAALELQQLFSRL